MNKLNLTDKQRLEHMREYVIDEMCMIEWDNKDYLKKYLGTTNVPTIIEGLMKNAMEQKTVSDLYDSNDIKYFHLLTKEQDKAFSEIEGEYTREEMINSFMLFEENQATVHVKKEEGITAKALLCEMFNIYTNMSDEELRRNHEQMFDLLYDEHGSVIMSEKARVLKEIEDNKGNLWVII